MGGSAFITGVDGPTSRYLQSLLPPEGTVHARLRAETARLPRAVMQIGHEQARFMQLLLRLSGAKRTIEIGVFTGYSALITAEVLPEDGRVVACDISEEWTSIARRYWQEAGVDKKIDLRLAPAMETLDALIAAGEEGSYDFAFIDADKGNGINYYERCLRLLRPGGLVAVDNTLWDGLVADPGARDADTLAIRALNAHLASDSRVDACLAVSGDGLHLARKR
jgi:predicted O-methyltransferase YrrM